MTGSRNAERGVENGAAPSRANVVEGPRLRGDGDALPDRRFVTFGLCSSVSRHAATLRRLIGVPAVSLGVVVGVLVGPLAASSSAAGTPDQSQPAHNSEGILWGSIPLAQTFTAGRSGSLSAVDLLLLSNVLWSDPLTVEISRHVRRGSHLASGERERDGLRAELFFVELGRGELCRPRARPGRHAVRDRRVYQRVRLVGGVSGDPYAGGTAWGSTGAVPSLDFAFKTYVESAASYAFDGFFAPIDDDAVNVLKAGQGVPVKFSLGGDQGLDILAEGSPSSRPVACDAERGARSGRGDRHGGFKRPDLRRDDGRLHLHVEDRQGVGRHVPGAHRCAERRDDAHGAVQAHTLTLEPTHWSGARSESRPLRPFSTSGR